MQTVTTHETIQELASRAQKLHAQEKQIMLQSALLIGELQHRRAAVCLGMGTERFAAFLGLTMDQFWKRAQAARVMQIFPEFKTMAAKGDTHVAQLAMIAPKITFANRSYLAETIPGKSKREVGEIIARLSPGGEILEKEPAVDLHLRLSKAQLARIDRAREVLSAKGHVPSLSEILCLAVEDCLEKRDPMVKAARAVARREKRQEAMDDNGKKTAPGQSGHEKKSSAPTAPGQRRPAIPAALRQEVWCREGGQCSWMFPDGTRCQERAMLEMEHVVPWARSKRHALDELTLRCRYHNICAAEAEFGERFMAAWCLPKRWRCAGEGEIRM